LLLLLWCVPGLVLNVFQRQPSGRRISMVFIAILILSLTVTPQDGTGPGLDPITVLLFISEIPCLCSGAMSGFFSWNLVAYVRSCTQQDAEAEAESATGGVHLPQSTVELGASAPAQSASDHPAVRWGLREGMSHGAPVIPPNLGTRAVLRSARAHGDQIPVSISESGIPEATAPAPVATVVAATSIQPCLLPYALAGMLNGDAACRICLDRPRNAALYACGHMLCEQCAHEVQGQQGRCPFCRKPIRDILRVYA
jgi:hypothetical protein